MWKSSILEEMMYNSSHHRGRFGVQGKTGREFWDSMPQTSFCDLQTRH